MAQMERNTLPSFSAVIEWENVRLSELDRTRRMLKALSAQIGEIEPDLAQQPELIILYDPKAVDPSLIQGLFDEAFHDRTGIALRLTPVEGGSYYRQKNHGAALARRELIMFVDSDVVPEPGWLSALIGSFSDPTVNVVCGNTYVDRDGLYSKAFAAFWFFPPRNRASGLVPTSYFWANNVVFRRGLFLDYRFPDLPLMRGQCVALAQSLGRDGHRIYIRNDARVSHPPPNGVAHYVKRGLCQGHDDMLSAASADGRIFLIAALRRYKRALRTAIHRIRDRRDEVGLSRLGVAGALGVALGYYSLAFVGECLTRVDPDIVRKRFSI